MRGRTTLLTANLRTVFSRTAFFRTAALLPLFLACGGCRLFGMGDAQVSFFSEPPGARVIVDKQDTGFVTPCRITLASRDEHRVELELAGY